jgi:hypothetical protein
MTPQTKQRRVVKKSRKLGSRRIISRRSLIGERPLSNTGIVLETRLRTSGLL